MERKLALWNADLQILRLQLPPLLLDYARAVDLDRQSASRGNQIGKFLERQLVPLPRERFFQNQCAGGGVRPLRFPFRQSLGSSSSRLQPIGPHRGDKNDCRNKKS